MEDVISQDRIKQQQQKIHEILSMTEPKTAKQIRRFVVIVNYYKSLWPKCSMKMAPLSAMTGKGVIFKWTTDHTKVFKDVQHMVSQDTMLTHPN